MRKLNSDQAASNVTEKSPEEQQIKDFSRQKDTGIRKLHWAKIGLLLQGYFPLGIAGVDQADYQTSADQVITNWLA